jgi:predicted ATPase
LNLSALPPRVEGVIERRIGRLDADLREILTAASVEGESFTAEVVARVLGLEAGAVVKRLSRELNSQHLLVREAGIERLDSQRLTRFQFRHNLIQTYLYQSLGASERAFLHETVGNSLETLYEKQEWQVAVPLARHFQEAGLTQKAVDYLLQAGEQANRLGAYEEAIEHFNQGLKLIPTLPGTRERTRQELKLQIALGSVWNIIKSWVAPEVAAAYSTARELSEELGETEMRFPVLWGLWWYYASLPDWHTAPNLAQELLQLATRLDDPILLTMAHRTMGITMMYVGKPVLAPSHFEQAIAYYDPQDHPHYLQNYSEDPGILSLTLIAFPLWYLGYPDQAQKRMGEALELAEELAHPFSLARVLGFAAAFYNNMPREFQKALERAEAALTLCQTEGFAYWLPITMRLRGQALVGLGQDTAGISLIQQAREVGQAMGGVNTETDELAQLANAYGKVGRIKEGLDLLSEALKIVENTGERLFEIEIHWVKGELLFKSKEGPGTNPEENRLIEAEACFLKAIEIAREQEAKSWELRATMSLSRLWLSQGKKGKARQLLAEIYSWFTEGFGTADLQEAKALLEELS